MSERGYLRTLTLDELRAAFASNIADTGYLLTERDAGWSVDVRLDDLGNEWDDLEAECWSRGDEGAALLVEVYGDDEAVR